MDRERALWKAAMDARVSWFGSSNGGGPAAGVAALRETAQDRHERELGRVRGRIASMIRGGVGSGDGGWHREGDSKTARVQLDAAMLHRVLSQNLRAAPPRVANMCVWCWR
jgi:hypothetical protein|eukprot:SAG25_NODE_1936_length_2124_cov_1.622222_3_plen_111_part_00